MKQSSANFHTVSDTEFCISNNPCLQMLFSIYPMISDNNDSVSALIDSPFELQLAYLDQFLGYQSFALMSMKK